MCVWERELCVCVCERERERERESFCYMRFTTLSWNFVVQRWAWMCIFLLELTSQCVCCSHVSKHVFLQMLTSQCVHMCVVLCQHVFLTQLYCPMTKAQRTYHDAKYTAHSHIYANHKMEGLKTQEKIRGEKSHAKCRRTQLWSQYHTKYMTSQSFFVLL